MEVACGKVGCEGAAWDFPEVLWISVGDRFVKNDEVTLVQGHAFMVTEVMISGDDGDGAHVVREVDERDPCGEHFGGLAGFPACFFLVPVVFGFAFLPWLFVKKLVMPEADAGQTGGF